MAAAYVVKANRQVSGFADKNAVVVFANSSADAIAMAKCMFDGDCDATWGAATASPIIAASDMSGFDLRLALVSPLNVIVADVTISDSETAAVKATGTLTTSTNPSDTNTVVIGTRTYTFQSSLTNVDGHVKIGASETASLLNLSRAINAVGGTPGTDYALATTANPDIESTAATAHTVAVRALVAGAAGNALATTDTLAAGGDGFGAATLTGGESAAGFDTFGDRAVVELNALSNIAGAAYNASTNVLTVAQTTDALGDHKLIATLINRNWEDAVTIPGFIGAIVDGGAGGDAVTVTFGADARSVPANPTLLSTTP